MQFNYENGKLRIKQSNLNSKIMLLTMKNVIIKYFERTCLWPQFQYKKIILENKFPNICSLIEQDITMGHLMDLFVLYLHNNMVYITVSTTT